MSSKMVHCFKLYDFLCDAKHMHAGLQADVFIQRKKQTNQFRCLSYSCCRRKCATSAAKPKDSNSTDKLWSFTERFCWQGAWDSERRCEERCDADCASKSAGKAECSAMLWTQRAKVCMSINPNIHTWLFIEIEWSLSRNNHIAASRMIFHTWTLTRDDNNMIIHT